jgi:hypothetical protein
MLLAVIQGIPSQLVTLKRPPYPAGESFTLGLFAVNGYHYLSHVHDVPRYGTQMVWKLSRRLTVTQNLLYGPDQANTSWKFWRLFSDSILEWKGEAVTLAAAYDIGTENAAEQPHHPRTFWTGGAFVLSEIEGGADYFFLIKIRIGVPVKVWRSRRRFSRKRR